MGKFTQAKNLRKMSVVLKNVLPLKVGIKKLQADGPIKGLFPLCPQAINSRHT